MNFKYSKTGYIYTSQNQKKELDANCFGDSQCIWIESSVGLGGWRLAQTFCAQLGANMNTVFCDLDIGTEIAKVKKLGVWTMNKTLLNKEVVAINGFQQIYEQDTRVIDLFEQFFVSYLTKNGRLIVKSNPTDRMRKFEKFIANYSYAKVQRKQINKAVFKGILDSFSIEYDFVISAPLSESLLSDSYENYRQFQTQLTTLSVLRNERVRKWALPIIAKEVDRLKLVEKNIDL